MIGIGIGIGAGNTAQADAPTLPPPPAAAHVATLAAYTGVDLVFDTGAAFGRTAASLPVAGTTDAPDGATIEARTVHASDTAQHTAWAPVATASGGAFAGTMAVRLPTGARAGSWLKREVRVAGSTATPARDAGRCGVGHVVGIAGQSEPRRTFLTDSGKLYGGVIPGDRVQIVVGEPRDASGNITGGGDPIASFSADRIMVGAAGGNKASSATHAADIFAKNSDDLVTFIDMTIAGTSRTHLSNDGAPFDPNGRRRWEDMLAVLDAAGWQDGVRPGLIVDMWTNADGDYAEDFMKIFKPFYTGKTVAGGTYTLGTDIPVVQIGTSNTVTHRHDHILFDLTGGGRGLFDPTETKITLCQHRYDGEEKDRTNWIYFKDSTLFYRVLGQEILRTKAFPAMLADPDASQVMVRGTEPINYENGTNSAGTWTDYFHPGQGRDGLPLYARHWGHAALHGLGLAGTSIPEFDGVTFDPAGAYADFTCSAGPVTTTRRLRGLAEPVSPPGPHWTDVLGFDFNDRAVERAEIRPDGSVRVHVPTGAGSGPGGAADWSKDRFWFGRGGATGTILLQADPLAGGWLNYPVIEASSLGLNAMYDDQAQSAGGVALRPMPPDIAPAAYRNAAVTMPEGAHFLSDVSIGALAGGAPVTQVRMELRAAMTKVPSTGVYLFGVENRVFAEMNRALGIRTGTFGGGTSSSPSGNVTPGVRHDFVLTYDLATKQVVLTIDGVVVHDYISTASATAINPGRRLHVLDYGAKPSPGFEFESFRLWLNDIAKVGAPVKTLLASNGAGTLNADPWKQGAAI